MTTGGKLRIRLVRSPIGEPERVRATLRGLGLTRVGKVVERRDDGPTRGMIRAVHHLVRVEGGA
ncbi:MAG: 50S ribosomal protein L30 [Candidatus Binatia bacterium]|nr:MAG: 50S ribosomal protein L30 [Candidatus Binatia bacterium]